MSNDKCQIVLSIRSLPPPQEFDRKHRIDALGQFALSSRHQIHRGKMNMLQTFTQMPNVVTNPEMWNAVLTRDASRDGSFVFAVKSTGIYCRPSCPARRPRPEQVSFFQVPEAAEREGFRACKRCHPRRVQLTDPRVELVRRICHAIDEHDEEP